MKNCRVVCSWNNFVLDWDYNLKNFLSLIPKNKLKTIILLKNKNIHFLLSETPPGGCDKSALEKSQLAADGPVLMLRRMRIVQSKVGVETVTDCVGGEKDSGYGTVK